MIQLEVSSAYSLFWTIVIPAGGIISLIIVRNCAFHDYLPFKQLKPDPLIFSEGRQNNT